MLDSARYWLGIGADPTPAKKPNVASIERRKKAASEIPVEKRLASIARAQELQLAQHQDELEEVEQNLKLALQKKDTATAKLHLKRKNELKAEIATLGGKHANARAQLSVQKTAEANYDHGLAIKDGAEQLKATVEAIDKIDLIGAADDIRESAAISEEQTEILAGSLFGNVNEDDVDEELAAMMQQTIDEEIASRLDKIGPVPTTTLRPPLEPTVVGIPSKSDEKAKEDIKE